MISFARSTHRRDVERALEEPSTVCVIDVNVAADLYVCVFVYAVFRMRKREENTTKFSDRTKNRMKRLAESI